MKADFTKIPGTRFKYTIVPLNKLFEGINNDNPYYFLFWDNELIDTFTSHYEMYEWIKQLPRRL